MNATQVALHRATCRDECCEFCQRRAETRAEDDGISSAEESARADQYERWLGW